MYCFIGGIRKIIEGQLEHPWVYLIRSTTDPYLAEKNTGIYLCVYKRSWRYINGKKIYDNTIHDGGGWCKDVDQNYNYEGMLHCVKDREDICKKKENGLSIFYIEV